MYRNAHLPNMPGETVNRGHDVGVQYDTATFEHLTFDNCGRSRDGTGTR